MTNSILGIDPGGHGAVAVLNESGDHAGHTSPMPRSGIYQPRRLRQKLAKLNV
jgi:hypothetical protein